jgi:hypothetical protein
VTRAADTPALDAPADGNGASPPAIPAPDERDRSVSFAELVHAHSERQRELTSGVADGPWEAEYRRRLHAFKGDHGALLDSYWCRFESSGVAITDRVVREPRNLWRRESIMRLHSATDWRTAHAPRIAAMLHDWETLGIRASEVLRGTSEKIALQQIYAASSRLLGLVDRKRPRAPSEGLMRQLERIHVRELRGVTKYYERAAENQARIVYFQGMAWGAALLALLVGAAFLLGWALGWLDPGEVGVQVFFVTIAMGATGAILSVMTRMAKAHGFNIDYEVGRKPARFLGALRPWIGAMFALALYIAIKGGVVAVFPDATETETVSFYAAIAFLAGFSERWAKVLIEGATGGGDDRRDDAPRSRGAGAPIEPGEAELDVDEVDDDATAPPARADGS